ncbi:recombinase family protein [Pseudescherichia sp.]|uniref:recombinase family protein n=1 Tax=Pseudescherichia sp. TaxID=2055881 RepID=UPI0028A16B28|nr:recombinase family protein [Pseudescherichia sp.]
MAKKLYSYQRWSSAVQKEGTTKDRQSFGAKEYAKANGLELVEIVDDGISAFKSVNSRRGALAAFISAVEQGYIESNSILYVEALDRISRDKVLTAVGLFNDVLELGITIVTGADKKVYTAESVNENSMDLLQSILLFSRAHEESKTKQLRTNGNALVLIRRFQEGEPTTIKSIGSHPWWIDASTNQHEAVKRHPKYWKVAKDAIDMFMEGKSVFSVCKYLNATYPLQWKDGKSWDHANIRKLRINPAVYGMRKITVDGQNYELENYFPPLITHGQYLRLQQIRETTKYVGRVSEEPNNINLLSGMKVFRCGHCGSTMMAMRHKDTIRYVCEKGRYGKNGCRVWSLPGELVEHCLMLVVTMAHIDMNQRGGVEKEDYTLKIKDAEQQVKDLSSRISNLTTLVANGLGNVDEVIGTMRALDVQRNDLKLELEVLTRKQILAQDNTFEELMMQFFNYAHWNVIQTVDHEYRMKLRDIVKSSIGDVRAWKVERRLYLSFQIKGHEEYFNFSAGEKPYEWGYHMGNMPFTEDKKVKTESTIEIPEDMLKEMVSMYARLHDDSMSMLNAAKNMLQVVGYPELDGKMFWPRK